MISSADLKELLDQQAAKVGFETQIFEALKELLKIREKEGSIVHIAPLPAHGPLRWKVIREGKYKGLISRVNCICGKETTYRVPLSSIQDFVCSNKSKEIATVARQILTSQKQSDKILRRARVSGKSQR